MTDHLHKPPHVFPLDIDRLVWQGIIFPDLETMKWYMAHVRKELETDTTFLAIHARKNDDNPHAVALFEDHLTEIMTLDEQIKTVESAL